jgi:hypothetical protein
MAPSLKAYLLKLVYNDLEAIAKNQHFKPQQSDIEDIRTIADALEFLREVK